MGYNPFNYKKFPFAIRYSVTAGLYNAEIIIIKIAAIADWVISNETLHLILVYDHLW